jgi:excisionase family DNA binding protein
LIDIATVAERLGVKVRYVRRLVAERRIEHVKVGRLIRFDPAEVDASIDRGRVSALEPRPLQRGRRAS